MVATLKGKLSSEQYIHIIWIREGFKKSREFSLTLIPYLFYFLICKSMGKMMLSKSIFLCAFRGQNNPLKTKNFLKNIQFEGLCTLLLLGHTVTNRVKNNMNLTLKALDFEKKS